MKAIAHLKELQRKHAKLDQKIQREQKSVQPDTLLITTLKKQKLNLKEQISTLQLA